MTLPRFRAAWQLRTVFFLAALLTTCTLQAQTGGLRGVIYEPTEENDGDTVEAYGITVLLSGPSTPTPVLTDFDGAFEFKGLTPGMYSVILTGGLYEDDTIRNVEVEPGEVAEVERMVGASEDVLDVVELTFSRPKDTEAAVVAELKESESLGDGISKEQISKGGDRDVGSAVTRIPGVTLIEGKFIVVRGLGQRYNAVQLNGINAPYTEPEQRGFALDIIPTSVVDRLLVYKTGAPDMPGDFAGSVLQIYTTSYVSERYRKLTIGTGVRAGTTFQDFGFMTSYTTDLFGFGKGNRAIPAGTPDNLGNIAVNDNRRYDVTNAFANDWNVSQKKAMPDLRLSYEFGNNFRKGGTEISTINNFRYSNTRATSDNKIYRYQYDGTPERNPIRIYSANDSRYQQTVSLSGMSNWQFRFNSDNKIEFKTFFNQLGLQDVTVREGLNSEIGNEELNYSLRYLQRSLWATQLTGKHEFNADRTVVEWGLGYALTARSEPDWRRVRTNRAAGTDDPYTLIIAPSATLFDGARFFSDLNENQFSFRGDIEHLLAPDADSVGVKLRAGYYTELKQRDFQARWMAYNVANGGTHDTSLDNLPLDEIFAPENIDVEGFVLNEGTNPTDEYTAQSVLLAGYAGIYVPLANDKIRLSGGLRIENYTVTLEPGAGADPSLDIDTSFTSFLPSFNSTFVISEKFQIRGAYSRTVNRPELRELARYNFYDFNLNADFVGNAELKPADIDNFDLRFEFYPSEGEIISIGGFYKRFINPIELYVGGTGNPVYQYDNGISAYSAGIELEFRKSLSFLFPTGLMSNTGLLVNGALIYSQVDVGERQNVETERPLQGQSPYVLNAGVFFQDDSTGWGVNLLYNTYGPRIFSVGDLLEIPTVWELPRNFFDVSVSKELSEQLTLKVTATNIFNAEYRLYADGNSDKKNSDPELDLPIQSSKQGQYVTAQLTIKF